MMKRCWIHFHGIYVVKFEDPCIWRSSALSVSSFTILSWCIYNFIFHFQMPLFAAMDDDLVKAICGYLRTFSSNKGTYVAFVGEPVHQMLFVFSGQLEVSNANTGRQCIILGPGDLCGKELLEWCSQPTTSTENLKPATQTIKCLTDVDAFALRVDDVKLLAIQFHCNGKFRNAFQRFAA